MSDTSAVAATYAIDSSLYQPEIAREVKKTLGQEDFLRLLTAQLAQQDPMNPQKDTEFMAQMAQFTALEQTKTMSSEIASLRADQHFSQANGLIGRTVELQTEDETTLQGVVEAVRVEAGTPLIVVNGQGYDLSQVLAVTPTQTAS